MLTIGYARRNPLELDAVLAAQQRDLRQAGCDRVFTEIVEAAATRIVLRQCLALLRPGDVLMVNAPDRLAQTVGQLLKLVDDLGKRGVRLVIRTGMPLDTGLPGSQATLAMLGGIARWERSDLRERQLAGIQRARAEGKYRGRQATINAPLVKELARLGLRPTRIARQMKIDRSSVYRALGPDYRVEPRPAHVPKQRLNPAAIQVMLRSMGVSEVARSIGCSRTSVYRLRDYADGKWR